MSCKSVLYTVLNTPTTVNAGGVVPLGTIVRRFGNSIRVDGNTITLTEPGYYTVSLNDTVQPTAATPISVSVTENGVPIAGAIATVTPAAASDNTLMQIPSSVVRVFCGCCKNLSVILSAAGIVTNATVTVEKV